MAEDLSARLDVLEARTAIADLIHDYARYIRYDDPAPAVGLFTPGGVFEVREGHPGQAEHSLLTRLEGQGEIRNYLIPADGKPHPIPLIHNLVIVVDGDRAVANSVMEADIYGISRRIVGEYHDTFARVDGRWYFAERIYTIFRGASQI